MKYTPGQRVYIEGMTGSEHYTGTYIRSIEGPLNQIIYYEIKIDGSYTLDDGDWYREREIKAI